MLPELRMLSQCLCTIFVSLWWIFYEQFHHRDKSVRTEFHRENPVSDRLLKAGSRVVNYGYPAVNGRSNNPAGKRRKRRSGCAAQASDGNDSETSSGPLRPPIHFRTESTSTITAAVMMRAVSEVLM